MRNPRQNRRGFFLCVERGIFDGYQGFGLFVHNMTDYFEEWLKSGILNVLADRLEVIIFSCIHLSMLIMMYLQIVVEIWFTLFCLWLSGMEENTKYFHILPKS